MAEQDNTTPAQLTLIVTINADVPWERLLMLDLNPFTQNVVIVHGDAGSLLELLGGAIVGSGPGAPGPASNASIEALHVVDKEEQGGSEAECPICLENLFENKEEMLVKEMPCGHRFHGVCIDKWLQMHGSCPYCRYEMPIREDPSESN